MSHDSVLLVVEFALLLVITIIVAAAFVMVMILKRQSQTPTRPVEQPSAEEPFEEFTEPEPDVEPVDEEEPEFVEPLPVDPHNLPSMKVYEHQPDKGRPRRSCYCHRRPIPDGPVLWWPMPGSPEVRLFCPEGITSMEASR